MKRKIKRADGKLALFKNKNPDNEVAAYRLAQLLGYDAVPKTERSAEGSIQEWIENTHTGEDMSNNRYYSADLVLQFTAMNLFDQIIGNDDRITANWLEDDKGKLWAIDHGHIFEYNWTFVDIDEAWHGGFQGRDDLSPAQIETIAEMLAQWAAIPHADIEREMVECGEGPARNARRIWTNIQLLAKEAQDVLKERKTAE